ncbi:hypothetical protein L6164_019865 [Bauhinia variegata]|uniref:Uncharacterized protein n=1 Tax=Bauhinia variegata TaxID=167791 RepID=A0ACB9MTP9_BAUVA|nr:hypothetical protein L6164_019865 [Bauhinia variegata]
MVGQTATKPSRSDEVLDADEQQRIADQIRAQFNSLAPKRPIKPDRSDPDASTSNPVGSIIDAQNIPELDKFQSLQSQSDAILSAGSSKDVQDEFVETQYYEQLTSIDKHHHTTGTGFIKVGREGGEGEYNIHFDACETKVTFYKSNPATNDWVPNVDEHQAFISSKPNRSESS